jgi:ribosomal protein S27E
MAAVPPADLAELDAPDDEGELDREPAAQGQRFRCPGCAANMTYDAATRAMACAFCGASVAIGGQGERRSIVEHDLEKGLATAARGYGVEVRRSRCQGCGAVVSFGSEQTATRCDFCDAPTVLAEASLRQVLRPESLVPFAIDREAARQAFGGWLGKLWFRPGDLRKLAAVTEAHGVYVPYWTFDCQVDSSWTADSGTYYWVTQRYTVRVNGRSETRTRRVRKIRWRPAWGERCDHHDDVLVCASRGLPAELAARLDTFDTRQLVPWQPAYLAGWKAEEYAVELNDGWTIARGRIEDVQERRCAGDVPGDTHRFLRVNSRFSAQTYKHVLLPVWVAAYRYRDRVYQFLVNGQTGEVEGKAPWSLAKIALASLLVLALVVAGVMLWVRANAPSP